jgi:hypothetical protein
VLHTPLMITVLLLSGDVISSFEPLMNCSTRYGPSGKWKMLRLYICLLTDIRLRHLTGSFLVSIACTTFLGSLRNAFWCLRRQLGIFVVLNSPYRRLVALGPVFFVMRTAHSMQMSALPS